MASYRHLAALGSSFASGPGIPPVVDRCAMRSGRNYAHVLAELLGARITDLTVAGATTATIVDQPQRTPGSLMLKKYPPQVAGIPADADLITLTAGGNDLHYLGSMLRLALAARVRPRAAARLATALLGRSVPPVISAQDVSRAAAGLERVVQAARDQAPDARVVLVDYLTILGPHTHPALATPFTPEAIDGFRAVGARLEDAFALAAARTDADLVHASALSRDHALGSAAPWVNGTGPLSGLGAWFHPNAAGMWAIAEELHRVLSS